MIDNILFVQYANSIYPFEDCTKAYFDNFYGRNRSSIGYMRMLDSFEVPKWIAEMSRNFPDARKDLYWVHGEADVASIGKYITDNGFTVVMFSVMDANKVWVDNTLAVIGNENPDVKVYLGGYGDYIRKYAEKYPFVTVTDSIKETAELCGVEYREGTDYSLFKGWTVLPRLTLSYGCLNHCDFCIVPKMIWEVPEETIMQQIDSFRDLTFELIYLDDKTFGQAKNYTSLAKYTDYIRQYNPQFRGFVVQTTAAQCLKKDVMKTFAEIGVVVVEIGLETYNQDILDKYHKPLRLKMMDKLLEVADEYGVYVLPNIIVGFEEETDESYERTYQYLNSNLDRFIGINLSKYTDYGDEDSLGEISFSNTPKKPLHEREWVRFNDLGIRITDAFNRNRAV